jgi:hypothetical protein
MLLIASQLFRYKAFEITWLGFECFFLFYRLAPWHIAYYIAVAVKGINIIKMTKYFCSEMHNPKISQKLSAALSKML